ncbi:hypothetical protein Y032_0011g1268 [Ancylostoma ceylanicum]|nr:hypothetical protein Y032_0011g1268 [Ancylostoma ceylanicum]
MEVCKTKYEDGIQTLRPLPMSLCHYPLGHPSCIAASEGGVCQCVLLTLMLSNSLLVLCLRCYVGIEGNVTEKLLPDPATHMCSYELRDPCKFSVPAYYKIYSVEDHLSEHCWGLRGRYVCSCRSDLCNGDIKLMQRKWADSPITDEKIRDCVQEYLKTRPDLEHPQNTTEASATDAYKPPAETANPSESHDFYRVRHKFLHTILSNTTAVEFNVTA